MSIFPFRSKFDPNKCFFGSDFHFQHKNLAKGVSSWDSGYRPFNNTDEMDNTLINNINKTVRPDDYLFFLGDFLFGDKKNALEVREKINCKNLFVTWGNHDDWLRKNPELQKKLFTWCGDYLEISCDKQLICMSHYTGPRVWNESHKCSWHCGGHSHGSLPDDLYSLSIDVGMDTEWVQENDMLYMTTNFGKHYYIDENQHRICRDLTHLTNIVHQRFHPYSFLEIKKIMKYKYQFYKSVDHHS